MSKTKDIERASRLYKRFREADPKRTRAVRIKLPKALMVMGTLEAVLYTTSHAGQVRMYKHVFSKGSRPVLAAAPGKRQLFIVGGRFHVTERGIVDLTPAGKEIG